MRSGLEWRHPGFTSGTVKIETNYVHYEECERPPRHPRPDCGPRRPAPAQSGSGRSLYLALLSLVPHKSLSRPPCRPCRWLDGRGSGGARGGVGAAQRRGVTGGRGG
ncbi:hypothetical protein Pcinc_013501 [Petrolisthes cinctipes]|uniref:Uncharacterized protein n=1 Tax=Petrolisthes cinctipes TaxID=88211 RepID=A0AAE1FYF5_PETCI|nr:hypothetical protein Pcinc_013501 [Petrolisthes cinctipes]